MSKKRKKNWGKEIRDVGILFIVIGVIMILLMIFVFSSMEKTMTGGIAHKSVMAEWLDQNGLILIIGAPVSILLGIIVKNIGQSISNRFEERQKEAEKNN